MSMSLSPGAPPPAPVGPNQASALVHQMSDQQLMQLLHQPGTPPAIQLAALQEAQSRQQLRGGAPQQGQPGPGTPPQAQGPAQAAMQPPHPAAPPPAPPPGGGGVASLPTQPMHMAQGGMVAFGGATGSFVGSSPTPASSGYDPSQYSDEEIAARLSADSGAPVSFLQNHINTTALAPYRKNNVVNGVSRGVTYDNVPPELQHLVPPSYTAGPADAATAARFNALQAAARVGPPESAAGGSYAPQGRQQLPQNDVTGITRGGAFGNIFPDRYPETNPAAGTLADQRAAIEEAKRKNQGYALMHMGAAMMSNPSQYAQVGLGAGLEAYAGAREHGQQAEQQGLAGIAQQQNEATKAQMGYAGQVDSALAHAYASIHYTAQMKGLQLTQQAQENAAKLHVQLVQEYTKMHPELPKLGQLVAMGDKDAIVEMNATMRQIDAQAAENALRTITAAGASTAGQMAYNAQPTTDYAHVPVSNGMKFQN
jgi:hypothetical protein